MPAKSGTTNGHEGDDALLNFLAKGRGHLTLFVTPGRVYSTAMFLCIAVAFADIAAAAPSGGLFGGLWTAFWCAPLIIQLSSLGVLGSVAILWIDAFGDFRRGGKRKGKSDETQNELGDKDFRSAAYSFGFGILIAVLAIGFAGLVAPECYVTGLRSQVGGVIPGLGNSTSGVIVPPWDVLSTVFGGW